MLNGCNIICILFLSTLCTTILVDVCSQLVGRDPSNLPISDTSNWGNLMIGNAFPCDGFVVAWDYYNTLAGSAYIGVFRQSSETEFFLVGYSQLPNQGVGAHRHVLTQPILVETGDFIGVFYGRNDRGGVIASTRREDNSVPEGELFKSVYISAYAENFRDGSPFLLEDYTSTERQVTFAVQADMSYDNVPGNYICPIYDIQTNVQKRMSHT